MISLYFLRNKTELLGGGRELVRVLGGQLYYEVLFREEV